MLRVALFLSLFLVSLSSNSQINKKLGDEFQVGLSSIFIPKFNNDNFSKDFSEWSISQFLQVNIEKKWHLGWRTYAVRAESFYLPKYTSWHFLTGPFTEYMLIEHFRSSLSVEAGYLSGDYCPNCDLTNPFYDKQMYYWSLMFEYKNQLFKEYPSFMLTLSFATTNAINRENVYGYNLPLVGFQYRFGEFVTKMK